MSDRTTTLIHGIKSLEITKELTMDSSGEGYLTIRVVSASEGSLNEIVLFAEKDMEIELKGFKNGCKNDCKNGRDVERGD